MVLPIMFLINHISLSPTQIRQIFQEDSGHQTKTNSVLISQPLLGVSLLEQLNAVSARGVQLLIWQMLPFSLPIRKENRSNSHPYETGHVYIYGGALGLHLISHLLS